MDKDLSDFAFGAFLLDEDVADPSDHVGALSCLAEIMTDGMPCRSFTAATTRPERVWRLKTKQRKSHSKSRLGCYNCKRRRVKCQETRPICGHCAKFDLKCEYPPVFRIGYHLRTTTPMFSLQDMRFFQHFIQSCYPHHPLGNGHVWTTEVPFLSQNYHYLMCAILGLAASDLMSQDPTLVEFAIRYRLKAIKAIKKGLVDIPDTSIFEEGNALMATCYALAFQSVLLGDGLAEFMTFCRGIVIVAVKMQLRGVRVIFSNFTGQNQMKITQPLVEEIPLLPKEWTGMAVVAIRKLEPLCKHPVDREYYNNLLEIVTALSSSWFLAYQRLSHHYGWWMQIPHDKFQHIVDPSNAISTLMASHWIALSHVMTRVSEVELHMISPRPRSIQGEMNLGLTRWLKHLNRQVRSEYAQYNEWPLWVQGQLDKDVTFFAGLSQ